MRDECTFLCDAMLGGLARWLRAAGYAAVFDVHARDGELVRRALEEGHCLLTSDSGIMDRYAVAQGLVRCVYVPVGLSPKDQLAHVLGRLGLPLREPRCMRCGGRLVERARGEVVHAVPEKVRRKCREFYACADCGRLYWRGTHWERISRTLAEAERRANDK